MDCSNQLSFDVGILSIFGNIDKGYREKLEENYLIVDKGYNCFPTNIPGTAYHKALLVKDQLEPFPLTVSRENYLLSLTSNSDNFFPLFKRRGKG